MPSVLVSECRDPDQCEDLSLKVFEHHGSVLSDKTRYPHWNQPCNACTAGTRLYRQEVALKSIELRRATLRLVDRTVRLGVLLGLLVVPALAQDAPWRSYANPSMAQRNVSADKTQVRDLHILFTDHLLGYYRIPEIQAADLMSGCPEVEEIQTPASQLLIEIAGERADGKTVLLGMGENFAPELGARTYIDTTGMHPKKRVPSNSIQPKAEWDNVTCFMWRAGYDALIPDKNDFYFGAQRLRYLAQQLASGDRPVHMLAANLAVSTDYWKKTKSKVPDSQKDLKFEPNLPENIESLDLADGDAVLPYLAIVRLKTSKEDKTNPYLCDGTRGSPDDLISENPICRNARKLDLIDTRPDGASRILTFQLPEVATTCHGRTDQTTACTRRNSW